jgi:diketogulonate reductase-like aldo/keto reductase
MEAIHSSGRAKSIGVSNFLPHHLCAILKTAKIIPAVNQIEYHPYLQQSEILALAKEHGITVEAYSPLTPLTKGAGGPVDEVVKAIAEQYKVSESVILLKWLTSQGIVAITTSGKEERLADYIEGFKKEFLLTADEVSEISKEGRKKTFRNYFGDEVEKSYKEAETAAHNNLEK